MKGFSPYNDYSYYASQSSNLSAFATPFSVNRPFIDPPDSSTTTPFRFTPIRDSDSGSLNPYGYSGLDVLDSSGSLLPNPGRFCNGAKPVLADPLPFFDSYDLRDRNSSSVVTDHWSSFSGFNAADGNSRADYGKNYELGFAGQSGSNRVVGFGNGKDNQIGVGIGSSLSSNQMNFTGSAVDERMNLGCQNISDSHGEVPHRTGWEKHSLPTNAEFVDDCWWRTTKPMPVDFSHSSVLQSPSLSLEPHHEAPLKLAVDSGNHHFSYTGVYGQHLGQQDKLSRVDAVSSTPITGSVTDLNVGIFVPDGDLGHNNFYDIKEAHPTPSLGTSGCFSLGHLRMNLDRNEPSPSNNAMISGTNVSGDVVDYIHKARHEFHNPNPNLGPLSLKLNTIQGVNSVDKALECGGDLFNPSVDSPCWKGAPTAHGSYYESSEALHPEQVPKNEKCFGSVIQEPHDFLLDTESNVRKPCDSSFQMHIPIVDQETSSAGSPRKISETMFESEDCKPVGAVSAGPFQSEPCCDYGLQYQHAITKMKENSVPPTKPIDLESGFSHDEHHITGENKVVSQKLHALSIGCADTGCNENMWPASGTSHARRHALSLSSSVNDAPTTPEKSAGKASTEKLNVQMLVDTMQNLSQLLLNHCSNDACALEERDCNILRDVISNLNTCVLKNTEQNDPAQECLSCQLETPRCAGESCGIEENVCFKGSQLTKIASESSMDGLENPLAQKADLSFGSGKPHLMPSDSIFPSSSAKMTKAENMTKALKNILSENFDEDESTESHALLYKNLWLEAEAALCSVSFKARYNQMKIEMEKHSYKQRDMEEQSKSEVIPSLSRSLNSAIEVNKCPNSDSSAQDLPVLDANNPKEPAQLKLSSDVNMPNSLTLEAEGSHNLYSFIQNYAVSGTNKEAAWNDEASVMARYNVIKSRADKSCSNTNDLETPSDTEVIPSLSRSLNSAIEVNKCPSSDSSAQDLPVLDATNPKELAQLKLSSDVNMPDSFTLEAEDSHNLYSFIQNYAVSATNKKEAAGNDEASVMARYNVIKSRADKSRSNTNDLETPSDTEDKLAPREVDNQNQVNFHQEFPIPGKNKTDYETSVLARFHILKSRVAEDSSSASSTDKLFEFSAKGIEDTLITKDELTGERLDASLNSYTAADKTIPKDIRLDLEDSQEMEHYRTYEFQLPNYHSDGLASDWEHV